MATTRNIPEYDRKSELKAFDDSKSGVKGLLDGGMTKIPLMFIHPRYNPDAKSESAVSQFRVPLIDLDGVKDNATVRAKIIDQVRGACENWGFFQVVNHGIPASVLEEMIDGIRGFHEQDTQMKKEFYTRDFKDKVSFVSNFDLFEATAATWKDSLSWPMVPNPPDPTEFPAVCRDIVTEYSKQVKRLGYTLFELLSEGLGLHVNHLKDTGCAEVIFHVGHYYPPCPEPELTLGASRHADSGFLTVLLQDQVGGLQVLHQNQWIDLVPMPGALVINVGFSLQVITNDRFKSIEHRVLANRVSSRVSMASAFGTTLFPSSKLYSPIKELLTQENPPKYKEATLQAHVAYLRGKRV
ncbi:1-aminocyclopropane-1-carboxylate oxidase homolog 1 [Vitis vinifera]|uniref:1-aminocyclopropane-1-carboxylate oxidase-like 1 n=2 Tax=Vitis vinifera TaxID=29760 RepID=A0A438JJV4_VITVI|nr:1-aminocyclopropane-1-carboxylate oxidase homolog 1 [Vitis vinifera]RVW46722.1 1-aminocyclopropane-1-carboxylate oxidase-like 1 [Vitis vinifera]RVX09235.1 1-aminocyclopropane-1-carboxylate oxidase-like 1 [Vitis vinifera]|eukprot:XP_002276308.1 PREDICTED: 1-aminocyclopropane-1-carboxylate oxidase homolog 1 [Vitis vinifera]